MISLFVSLSLTLQPVPPVDPKVMKQVEETGARAEAAKAKPAVSVSFGPEVEASIAQMKAKLEVHRPEMDLLIERSEKARRELQAEYAKDAPDAEALRDKAVRMQTIRSQIMERTAAHVVDAYMELTPEQRGHVKPFVRGLLLGNPIKALPPKPPHPAPQAPKPIK